MLPATSDDKPDYKFMQKYIISLENLKIQNNIKYIKSKLSKLGDIILISPLNKINWKAFPISSEYDGGLFTIHSTNSGIDANKIIDRNDKNIPYITRTYLNNGIASFVGIQQERYKMDGGNVITIGLDTQTVFYQPYSFYTGQNIQILYNDYLNEYIAKFLIPCIKYQINKLSWGGNGASLGRLKRMKIMLPATSDDKPDYEFMEQYIRNIMIKKYNDYLNYIST